MKFLATISVSVWLAAAYGLVGVAQAQVPFIFDTDLVAYWPFDDDMDTTPDDLAPAGVVADDGQLIGGAGYQGGTDLPPISGNVDALELSGTSGYLNVPDSSDLDLTGDYTLALWVKPGPSQGSFADILRKKGVPQTTGYGIEAQSAGGNVYFSGWKNGTVFSTSFRCWGEFPPNPAESFPLTADTWQHLAVAKTGGTRLVYVNAVLVNSCTHTDPVVGTNNAPLQLGAWTVFGRPCLGIVLHNTSAVVVHEAEAILGEGIALLGQRLIQAQRGSIVAGLIGRDSIVKCVGIHHPRHSESQESHDNHSA